MPPPPPPPVPAPAAGGPPPPPSATPPPPPQAAVKSTDAVPNPTLTEHASPVFLISSATQLDDFFGFCKKMNPKQFEQILKEGQLMQCGKDSIIYLQGETSDAFYVINDGTVEVVVSDDQGENPVTITNLNKGDLFGEIGLLTEVPRTASVRVPESATLLRFDRNAFSRLITTIPAFGHFLAMVLARRLHKTTQQLHFYSNARELSGSLDFFDLPTIFQTISLSQQHGIMHVYNLTNEIMGEFAFAMGSPISARYLHLYGVEALLELFQVTPHAQFGFTRLNEQPVVESPLDISNVNEFTMHAVHLRDEMIAVEEKLKLDEEKPVKRVHSRIEWKFPDHGEVAKALWQAIVKEPQAIKTLLATVPACRYHILCVIDRLFDSGQLAYAEMTPYGYR